uniref:Post-SET domain-containing protein n=1 Tax=Panagrolaimus davidi TaxID=227884 RepID=A0A914QQQ8_9BILA
MRYSNHSCDPNLITQIYTASNYMQHVCFFAKRDIKAGEELTYSYASNHHKNENSFKCYCGAASCKGYFKA